MRQRGGKTTAAIAGILAFAMSWMLADANMMPAAADATLDGEAVACYAWDRQLHYLPGTDRAVYLPDFR